MHDTDNDGMITLEEYRHVSLRRWEKLGERWETKRDERKQ